MTLSNCTAIIVCAGLGSRLMPLTHTQPKCLTEVGGTSILGNNIKLLTNQSLKVIVVIGHLGEKVQDFVDQLDLGARVHVVKNPNYANSSTLVSFCYGLTACSVDTDILYVEGDVIFKNSLLDILNKHHSNSVRSCALVSKYSPDYRGSFVTLNRDVNVIESIVRNAETQDNFDIEASVKLCNLIYFAKNDWHKHFLVLNPESEAQYYRLSMEEYLDYLVDSKHLSIDAMHVDNADWYEVDDADDLRFANKLFRCSPN